MSKRKLVVIDADYPGPDLIYGDVFVHTRLKKYKENFDVKVVGWNRFNKQDRIYTYESIDVFISRDIDVFYNKIKEEKPDLIIVHFVQYFYMEFLKKINIPVVVFVHGSEALGWYRRLYDFFNKRNFKHLPGYILSNVIQLFHLRRFIKFSNNSDRIVFVFVSQWMKRITESDTFIKIKNSRIIPNPVDTDLFSYTTKEDHLRKKILLIRSFDSYKYANYMAIEAIEILSKRPVFQELEFHIYGKGYLFEGLIKRVRGFHNVKITNHFIENVDIPKVHANYGVFLCPTKQDAQGVSMCEAMASGLIPLTCNNTAIPEFMSDKASGYFCADSKEMADYIESIANDPVKFQKLSSNARKEVYNKCSSKLLINIETELFKHYINK